MVKKWLYGDAWERFPIEYGEIWEAGANRLACYDALSFGVYQDMGLGNGFVDMVYTDPPWNKGNINAFRTKAEMSHWTQSFEKWLDSLLGVIYHYAQGPVYVEMGKDTIELLSRLAAKHHIREIEVIPITYYHRHPAWLFYGSAYHDYPARLDHGSLNGLDDEDTPREAIKQEYPKTILDPCIGRGGTARAAWQVQKEKIQVYGVELNKRRLANVLAFYAEQGLNPRRVGKVTGTR